MNLKITFPALAWAASACLAVAQDGPPPPPPGDAPRPPAPQEQGGAPGPRFHILPRHVQEEMNLTPDQQKQVSDLETETKGKLLKILTPEQGEKLEHMRPPQLGKERGPRERKGEGPNQGPPPEPQGATPGNSGPGAGDEPGPPRPRRPRDGASPGSAQDGQGPPQGQGPRGPRDRQGPPPPQDGGRQRPPADSAATSEAAPAATPAPATAPLPAGVTRTPATLAGGFETNPVDHGRPVVLVAGALGVPPEVFRDAFSRVHPADQNVGPTGDEARANKVALMSVLAKYGITNDELDAASNQYRYVKSRGQLWKHKAATVNALVKDGAVVGFEIADAGAGYSSPPQVSVAGMPNVHPGVKLTFDKDFAKNGSIQDVSVESGH